MASGQVDPSVGMVLYKMPSHPPLPKPDVIPPPQGLRSSPALGGVGAGSVELRLEPDSSFGGNMYAGAFSLKRWLCLMWLYCITQNTDPTEVLETGQFSTKGQLVGNDCL
jgi:hypothetical protein